MAQKPEARTLFAFYHLGLDTDGSYKFRNLQDCARRWNASAAEVQQWLQRDQIDAEAVKQVPFNLTRFHVDAQFVAPADAPRLIDQAWKGYQMALRDRRPDHFQHDVDYDDVWDKTNV